jgi:hypothetical protein
VTFASQLLETFTPLSANYADTDVTQSLSWAQSMVETYCNRTFDAESSVRTVDPANGRALLPDTPVTAVTLVEGWLPDGVTGMSWKTLVNYAYNSDTGLIYDTTGLPGTVWTNLGFSWPWLPESLRVTYSHGFATVPQPLIDVAVRLVLQNLDNPYQYLEERVGQVEFRREGAFSAMDAQILDRFSEVTIA